MKVDIGTHSFLETRFVEENGKWVTYTYKRRVSGTVEIDTSSLGIYLERAACNRGRKCQTWNGVVKVRTLDLEPPELIAKREET